MYPAIKSAISAFILLQYVRAQFLAFQLYAGYAAWLWRNRGFASIKLLKSSLSLSGPDSVVGGGMSMEDVFNYGARIRFQIATDRFEGCVAVLIALFSPTDVIYQDQRFRRAHLIKALICLIFAYGQHRSESLGLFDPEAAYWHVTGDSDGDQNWYVAMVGPGLFKNWYAYVDMDCD